MCAFVRFKKPLHFNKKMTKTISRINILSPAKNNRNWLFYLLNPGWPSVDGFRRTKAVKNDWVVKTCLHA